MKRIPNTPVAWVFNSAGSQSTLNTHNPLQYQGDTLSSGPKTIAEELDEDLKRYSQSHNHSHSNSEMDNTPHHTNSNISGIRSSSITTALPSFHHNRLGIEMRNVSTRIGPSLLDEDKSNLSNIATTTSTSDTTKQSSLSHNHSSDISTLPSFQGLNSQGHGNGFLEITGDYGDYSEDRLLDSNHIDQRIVAPNVDKLTPASVVEIRLESSQKPGGTLAKRVSILCSVDVLKMFSSFFFEVLVHCDENNMQFNEDGFRPPIVLAEQEPDDGAAFLYMMHQSKLSSITDWSINFARLSVNWQVHDMISTFASLIERNCNDILNRIDMNHWRSKYSCSCSVV